MLLTLIKNEFIKIFKRSKTWIVFGLFIVFIGITAFGTWMNDKNMKEWTSPEYQIQQAEEQLVHIRNDIKRAEEDGDQKWIQNSKEIETSLLKQIDINKEIIKNGISEDAWKKQLDESIKSTENTIKQYEEDGIREWNKRWYAESKQQLDDLKYLKNNNIKPLQGWEYQAFNFLQMLNSFFGLGVLIAGISVFMSDMVSGECTPATLKFLLVQPVTRGKILFSKFIVSTVTVLSLILIPQLVGMTVVNMTSDVDASKYPVRVEQKYEKAFDQSSGEMIMNQIPDTSKMITNTENAFRTIGYQSLFILSACSIVFMISTLFKSSMTSMAVSVISTIFLSIGTQAISSIRNISHLLFTTYADAGSLVTSKLALMYQNPKLTTTNGIICLIITAIIAYTIAHINFIKKDILI
ncbi:ABC transporter permease [Clostridium sartagoforme AAU1]|jgi:ABC-2 type transport system permease protein|uniref:ABC transporter permease n=1 Tax=Clostridium sartagoforme AAU1 TaxID=1202534 RepID=R9BY26_9CLOT|nr:ABC transporter permease subunit [Clostridium sartagoforme]EOR19851.1 ABC transporter permease [Clostridium sartagoforme AAU1]